MADNQVKIVFIGDDKDAVRNIDEVKQKLGELGGDDAVKNAQDAGGKVGNALVGKLKTIIATAGIGVALKKTIMEGADYEQAVGGIETLYGKMADVMIANANRAYKTAGLSANQYMETVTSFSASLLQGLGGDTAKASKYADQAITDMSDNANKFGTDMASIQNAYQGFAKQNYTMLDNLKLGYGGTKQEMERLIQDANRVKEANGEMGDLSIESFADVTEAIHIMQTELGVTGTTAKEAETTLTGSLNAMKGAFSNFMAQLSTGGDVGTAMSNLATSFTTFAIGNLLPAIVNIGISIPTALLTGIQNVIPALQTGFQTMITKVFGEGIDVSAGLQMIIDKITAFFSNVPALIQSGKTMIKNLASGIKANLPTILSTAGNLVGQLVGALIKNAPQIIKGGISLIGTLAKALISSIPTLVQSGISMIGGLVKGLLSGVGTKIGQVVEKIKKAFKFNISLPKIKLPHFSIKPAGWKLGDLLKGSIPKLGISWYAKGGIFTSPQVVGVGEKGAEAVLPIDKMKQYIKESMADSDLVNAIGLLASQPVRAEKQDFHLTLELGGSKVAEKVYRLSEQGKAVLVG